MQVREYKKTTSPLDGAKRWIEFSGQNGGRTHSFRCLVQRTRQGEIQFVDVCRSQQDRNLSLARQNCSLVSVGESASMSQRFLSISREICNRSSNPPQRLPIFVENPSLYCSGTNPRVEVAEANQSGLTTGRIQRENMVWEFEGSRGELERIRLKRRNGAQEIEVGWVDFANERANRVVVLKEESSNGPSVTESADFFIQMLRQYQNQGDIPIATTHGLKTIVESGTQAQEFWDLLSSCCVTNSCGDLPTPSRRESPTQQSRGTQ